MRVKKELLDKNIYSLDKNYLFNFKTGKIKNKDKTLDISTNGDFKIFSKNSKVFSLLVSTKNLDKLEVEVCNSALDINSDFFI